MLLRFRTLFAGRINISPKYYIRRMLWPDHCPPCFLRSSRGAYFYLSRDPVDDLVLDQIMGYENEVYFPALPRKLEEMLDQGASILDIGGYNGFWTCEMLLLYPKARATLIECSPTKIEAISMTLSRSNVIDRTILVKSALAGKKGVAWLVESEQGSWGDWIAPQLTPDQAGVPVKTVTLSEAVGDDVPVLVKCNAEGGEFELGEQLGSLPQLPLLMVIMVHPTIGDSRQLHRSLANLGYELSTIAEYRSEYWLRAIHPEANALDQ